ncbi:MAG: DUF4156 domain-containing protein [Proteobacteria bacterium]|nr:DUF4156 domain-containing protein [Pseudomonadota bacterium]
MSKFLPVAVIACTLSACTWVQVTPEGESVQLAETSEIRNCRRVGSTQAQTLSRVLIISRGGERLQAELADLARNQAGDMGGNTIVPESVIDAGKQSFGVYSCPSR